MTKFLFLSTLLLSSLLSNAQVTLDDWYTTEGYASNIPSGYYSNTMTGEGIIGGQRDIEYFSNTAGPTTTSSMYFGGGAPGYFEIGGSSGYHLNKMVLTYDGNDDLVASTLDATNGLGGINMLGTGSFQSTITFTDPVQFGTYSLKFRVYSSPTSYSDAVYQITSQVSSTPVLVSFTVADFTTGSGATAAANFAAVTAIQMILDINSTSNGWDFSMQGGITVPSPSNPLPLNWISFSGFQQEHQIQLNWTVANEKSSEGFTIERSIDGEKYTAIGDVRSNHAGAQSLNYRFIDATPIIGINFYRIKQTDLNGSFTYSTVSKVNYSDKGYAKAYTLYPSPTNDIFTIENRIESTPNLQGIILDMQGKELMKFAINNSKTLLSIGHFVSGTYVVKLSDGKSFLIQKQ